MRSVPRPLVVAAVVVVVAVIAAVLGRFRDDPATPTAPPSGGASADADGAVDGDERAVADGRGATSDEDESTGGAARTEGGAVAAAVEYATAPQEWLYLADDQILERLDEVAVPDARDALATDLLADLRPLRDELQDATGTVWFVVAPLATRVDQFDADNATVRVWVVRVLSADGVAAPQSGWHTVTLELAWHRTAWRLAAVSEAEGPTPQIEAGLQPWAPDYLDQELTGFVRVGAA